MGGIFHQTPPLPDAAMRAQRARNRLERKQTQAVRRSAGRAMDAREPGLRMPHVPLGIEIAEVNPGTTSKEPLAHGIHLLLHPPLRRRVTGETPCDGKPILPRTRECFGMQLAALAHRVFDDGLGPVIEQLVGHPTKEGKGMLVAGPEGGQILSVRALAIGVSAVAERQMKGVQGPGMLSAADILIAPIHLRLVTGGRFTADVRGDGTRRPQNPNQPWHNGVGAGEAVMSVQVAIDAGRPQPRCPDQPWFNQRA